MDLCHPGHRPIHLRLQPPPCRILLPLTPPSGLPTIRNHPFSPHPDPRGLCPSIVAVKGGVDRGGLYRFDGGSDSYHHGGTGTSTVAGSSLHERRRESARSNGYLRGFLFMRIDTTILCRYLPIFVYISIIIQDLDAFPYSAITTAREGRQISISTTTA